jgi:hypothetical protein
MNGRPLAARIALVGVLLVTASPASAGTDYVPFVTDFGPAAAAPAHTPVAGQEPRSGRGNDWTTVGIDGGVGATLVVLLAGAALIVARHSRKEQWR